ncbi:MAG: pyridoxamine 5'-phosphate oxidase family protein [bacterium]|nr:pyridoxamine 5'-phosphate oxidase family protein [bacterium]
MSRRAAIRLSPEEQEAFLGETRKASLATIDQDGFPHVVAMGFVAKDGALYMTSYAKAQKVLNIRRNPQVGVMIETGDHYAEYRGVMIRGRCEIVDETPEVAAIMQMSMAKEGEESTPRGDALSRAPKRVGLKIIPEKIATWDHTKLGGNY